MLKNFFKRLLKSYLARHFPPVVVEKYHIRFLSRFFFFQRLLGINGTVPWPVHWSSVVSSPDKIVNPDPAQCPGIAPGCYIQAYNGIVFGYNVLLAAGVKLVSANHDEQDYARHLPAPPITFGDNVWVGANAVILPGLAIGHNVIIGAGSVVTRDIPDDSVVAGNPARFIRAKKAYKNV